MTEPGDIDWSVFEGMEPATCYCRCGAVWHSQIKLVSTPDNKSFEHIAQIACPACGSHKNMRRSSSPPEKWTINP